MVTSGSTPPGAEAMGQSSHCGTSSHVDLAVVTFLDFVRLTRANFLVILGAVTLGVLTAFVWTLNQPVLYTATSRGSVVPVNGFRNLSSGLIAKRFS
jgi:hypothetical protein